MTGDNVDWEYRFKAECDRSAKLYYKIRALCEWAETEVRLDYTTDPKRAQMAKYLRDTLTEYERVK